MREKHGNALSPHQQVVQGIANPDPRLILKPTTT
jgi:hypothetical protein